MQTAKFQGFHQRGSFFAKRHPPASPNLSHPPEGTRGRDFKRSAGVGSFPAKRRAFGPCPDLRPAAPPPRPTLAQITRGRPGPNLRAGLGEGRIGATWAESQWIVAARPLCHLQYPVAYLSRLQRILPAARWEFLQGVPCGSSAAGVSPTTRAFGGRGPYCWSANGRRARASLLARILT